MKTRWLFSTIGKRGYIAQYFRDADPSIHIIGSGRTKFTPGFASCDETVLMPDILSEEYPAAVIEFARSQKINAILSFADPDVDRLSMIRPELTAMGTSCFFPGQSVARMGFDKFQTAEWALANGITVPQTVCDPVQAASQLALPMIRKPRFGSASVGVSVVRHERDIAPPAGNTTEYIWQELIQGTEVNIEICGDLTGRPVAVSAWKKMISRNGETELAVTVRRDDLTELGILLGEKAGIIGPCDVDVMERDGRLYLIEFNMRFGGGYPVSHLAGADFPGLLARIQRGDHPPLHTGYAGDIFMMKTLHPFGGPVAQADETFRSAFNLRNEHSQ